MAGKQSAKCIIILIKINHFVGKKDYIRPSFRPRTTASRRLWTWSFNRTCWVWLRTVAELILIAAAMSGIFMPLCRRVSTSVSLGVRALVWALTAVWCVTYLVTVLSFTFVSGWHKWTNTSLPGALNSIRAMTIKAHYLRKVKLRGKDWEQYKMLFLGRVWVRCWPDPAIHRHWSWGAGYGNKAVIHRALFPIRERVGVGEKWPFTNGKAGQLCQPW